MFAQPQFVQNVAEDYAALDKWFRIKKVLGF